VIDIAAAEPLCVARSFEVPMSDTVSKSWPRAVSGSAVAAAFAAPGLAAALVVAAGSFTIICAALFMQYVMLVAPCPLCLEQRKFHYAAIPLALLAGAAAYKRAPRRLITIGLALVGVILFAGAAVAAYHAGVEWKWWAGPADCSGPITAFGSAGGLLAQMQATSVVRCDEASWRLLGLSLAGYNALISLAMVAIIGGGLWGEKARGG
jgi:disulfide bond formation protein DsbB